MTQSTPGPTPLPTPHVLIVTGGLISATEKSLIQALRRWGMQFRHADAAWLDFKVKLAAAEPLVGLALQRLGLGLRPVTERAAVGQMLTRLQNDTPSLTEVVLMTLLHQAGITFDAISLDALFGEPVHADGLLARADCVFLSTTYLHDLSELAPILARIHQGSPVTPPKIVLGGALMGAIHARWEGMPGVDLVAVGYGELLADTLATWLRSGYQELVPPPTGRVVRKQHSHFVYSGVPSTRSLDFLPRPDWALAAQVHGRAMPMIYYESVRGCPYRCSFCNYPYLFDDTQFRYKSAVQMADDWEYYVDTLGVEYITCLDSLFTMPRPRLRAFCQELIRRKVKVKWICYARADDLADEATVALMKAAGAHQVQIGIESGDAQILANMNKDCTVEANRQALRNCRSQGLTSVISLIVGYPGETAASLARTYDFLAQSPPDFYFLAAFSTRIAGVPILRPEMKARFGLHAMDNLYSMAPYWRHATMSCVEVGDQMRQLDRKLMVNRVALNALLFYPGMLSFTPDLREPLLAVQQRVARRGPLRWVWDGVNRWVDGRMARDLDKHLAVQGEPAEIHLV